MTSILTNEDRIKAVRDYLAEKLPSTWSVATVEYASESFEYVIPIEQRDGVRKKVVVTEEYLQYRALDEIKRDVEREDVARLIQRAQHTEVRVTHHGIEVN